MGGGRAVIALLLLAIAGLTGMAAVLVLRAAVAARWRAELVPYRIGFPRGLDPAAVTAFLAGLSGLAPTRWRRFVTARALVLEVTADATGIRHHVLLPPALADAVTGHLRAALPGLRLEPAPEYAGSAVTAAVELGLSSAHRPLRHEPAQAINAAVLASLFPLGAGEAVVVQLVIAPEGAAPPVPGRPARHRLIEGVPVKVPAADAVRALRAKRAWPLFGVALRVGALAPAPPAAWRLVSRVTAAVRSTAAPGVHWVRRVPLTRWAAGRLAARVLPLLHYPAVLNAAELAALVAWPLGDQPVVGLPATASRQLPPAPDLPRVGRVVAVSNFPGLEKRPLALTPKAAMRHLHIHGPSGAGKSTLLANLALQDCERGAGVVVIDPQGDLNADIADRMPRHRRDDVDVLDVADAEWPVGFNVLATGGDDRELMVEQTLAVFATLWREFWGPRSADVLRAALATLAATPGMTLCEVPLILTDAHARQRLVSRLDDHVLAQFWSWFDSLSAAERTAVVAPVLNKVRSFTSRRRIRHIVGQAAPAFSFDEALARNRIVLITIPRGLVGSEAAALLGSLIVSTIWRAVERRSALPPAARPSTFLYLDEVQHFLHTPADVAAMMVEARKLRLALTLAHQHFAQLPPALRQAILANAASRVAFRLSADDAQVAARELAPHLDAADLQGLGDYECVARLAVGNGVAAPATGVTVPLPPPTGLADTIRARSRARLGQAAAAVEAALRQRAEHPGPGPVGRRRAS